MTTTMAKTDDSLMPLLIKYQTEIQQTLDIPKQKVNIASYVWNEGQKIADIKINTDFTYDPINWTRLSQASMLQHLQLYADQAEIAKRENALNLQKLTILQQRLSFAETANKRLLNAFHGFESKITQMFYDLTEKETSRMNSVKTLLKENQRYRREFSDFQQELANQMEEKQKLEAELSYLQSENHQLSNNKTYMKKEYEEAVRREKESRNELHEKEMEIVDLKRKLDSERRINSEKTDHIHRDRKEAETEILNSREKIESLKRQLEKAAAEKIDDIRIQEERFQEMMEDFERQSEERENYYKRKNSDLQRELQKVKASRLKYCNLLQDHLELLNKDKAKITNDLRSRIAQSYRQLNNQLNHDGLKGIAHPYWSTEEDEMLLDSFSDTTTSSCMIEQIHGHSRPQSQNRRRNALPDEKSQTYDVEGTLRVSRR